MPKFLVITAVLVVAPLVFIQCGNGGGAAETYPALTPKLPDLTGATTIGGIVKFEGKIPVRRTIEMGGDAWCKSHQDKEKAQETDLIVSESGGLKDALVLISKGLEAYTFDYEKTPAVMDQVHCMYVPTVLAVRTFQPVEFRTSDTTNHNVNTLNSVHGQGFNKSISGAGSKIDWQFRKPEVNMRVICNIHTWMRGWVHVVDHPYFTLTKEDGSFTLPNVPPGTYEVEVVHHLLGTKRQSVTVVANTPAALNFALTKK